MTTIEERALALVNEICEERGEITYGSISRTGRNIAGNEALCRALETHDATLAEFEAFRRKVSDAVRQYERELDGGAGDFAKLRRFIIAKPVDPLVAAVKDCEYATLDSIEPEFAADLRAALAKRGLKLVEVGDAD